MKIQKISLPQQQQQQQYSSSSSSLNNLIKNNLNSKYYFSFNRLNRIQLNKISLLELRQIAENLTKNVEKANSELMSLLEIRDTLSMKKDALIIEVEDLKLIELINEDWDLIIIDDLFWSFGFALTTLQQRLWEKGSKINNEPKSIIYSTAGQTLLSSESIKSTVEQFYMPNIARFGVPNFTWKELYIRSSLQLSDSIDRLGWPLAKGPEMINIGAHCRESGKLPEEFKKFIEEEDSEGIIYAAFGTYPEWSLAPKRILSSLIGAFQKLSNKYKIIFTYNGPPIENIGKNIMLAKWAPQLEILAHPKTKVFITHGGLKSIREGLCSGIPIIVMPLFAEQAHNAQQILFMGIGPVINKYTLNINSVYSTIYSFTQIINQKWDLVLVTELFNSHGYSIANLLYERDGVPYIFLATSMIMSTFAWAKAAAHNWVIHPHPFSPTPGNGVNNGFNPSLFHHRLIHSLEGIGDFMSIPFTDYFISPIFAKFNNERNFNFAKFITKSSAATVDSIEYLGFPQPEISEVIRIGDHCEKSTKLPEEYLNFVENPKSKGTIYIAFGTAVAWARAPPQLIEAFFTAFSKLDDYRFIFAFKGSENFLKSRERPPQHIRIVEWAPQLNILAHPKTKVFLTHGGLKSVKESLCSKTPMLAMPVFAEQNHNTHMVLKFGIGIALNKFDTNAENLYLAIKELLDNPKYGERVEKLQSIFIDRPIYGLDGGEFLIKRII
ncbi:UDP-glucuronosyltransferase, partial [Meloidogyne graminicola]